MNINKEDARNLLQQVPLKAKSNGPDPQVILATKRAK